MRWLLTLLPLSVTVLVFLAQIQGQHKQKPQTIGGEVVCLSCYLTHGAKGKGHAKCAIACINKGLPMGILTKDGKLFVALEDHPNADAYQQLKKFAAKMVTVTGVIATRSGITGIAVQKVSIAATKKTSQAGSAKVQYGLPDGLHPTERQTGQLSEV